MPKLNCFECERPLTLFVLFLWPGPRAIWTRVGGACERKHLSLIGAVLPVRTRRMVVIVEALVLIRVVIIYVAVAVGTLVMVTRPSAFQVVP